MGVARVKKCQNNCDYCDCIWQVKDEIIIKYGYDLTDIFTIKELEKHNSFINQAT